MTPEGEPTKSEQVYSIIQEHGPILPVDIVKKIGGNTILTGALISDLVRKGKVKVTKNIRVGSSPLYYVSGQEERLETFLHLLSESERRAVEILKKNGVIFENEIPELYRIGLMNASDFSIPLNIKYKDTEYHAFKWFLLDAESTKTLIQNKLEETAGKDNGSPVLEDQDIEENQTRYEPEQPVSENVTTGPTGDTQETTSNETTETNASTQPHESEQLSISLNALQEDIKNDNLLNSLYGLSQTMGFKLRTYDIVRKNREVNAIIRFSSPFGTLTYFAKALDKKRISPSDLYSLFAEAQIKKLPALLITGGELQTQAQKLVDKELTTIKVYKISWN